ncbi:hypothetical protein RR45_GL001299 [Lactococcus chungangensis CAU 28 = DSM 22330]|uniref:Uncharacterized protein n=1 Tax=Pseudolactococcus chungangensis CAU 28 = DSM 22330 TaxID=1122154 RepID=A0A1K2H4R9_9LACT|nr:hypothetical protein [Lactococcus chungangensis]PCS04365.1 hypothetical protein RR45_GL001299 [Lactococcus chungangensis CAU 28 = DSM 22330]SFZ70240.1 hypothetical protein SAMN02746068_00133 [Lactococcus chungangensis CAU 28 = DSM 22330]
MTSQKILTNFAALGGFTEDPLGAFAGAITGFIKGYAEGPK